MPSIVMHSRQPSVSRVTENVKHGLRWRGLETGQMTGLRVTLDPKGEKQPGLTWSALPLRQPSTLQMRNILDKVPKRAEDEIREELRTMYYARKEKDALRLKAEFIQKYQSLYPKVVESLKEAGDRLFTYFVFPKCHWPSIKSTNVIESIFSSVKLRTDAARRIRRRDSATYLVYKLLMVAEGNLNRIHGFKLIARTIEYFKKQLILKVRRNAA